MTIDYFCFDGDPGAAIAPHRPGLTHVGGGAWEDDQQYPPNPLTDPSADALNEQQKVLVALAKFMPTLTVAIHFVGGAPVIDYAVVAGTDALDPATDLTLTDNADGDTSIEWPASSMAATNQPPDGPFIYENTAIDEMRTYRVAHGVRVVTKMGGVATDAAFKVNIYGDW